MKTQEQTLNSLKKCVVQFARNPLSLCQSRPETLVQPDGCLPHPKPIQSPHNPTSRQNAQRPEPRCLIECRCHRKAKCCTRFIPQAIIVARDHVEGVAAGSQICVKRLATALRVLPFVVVTFQSVS